MLLAGFLVAEMPVIRRALDEAGGNSFEMIVCTSDLLYKPVQEVFEKGSEPDWLRPIPSDWVDGGGWGQERVVLFQNIPQLNQLEIVQVLYDVGIPPRIHSMSLDMVDDVSSQVLGHVLGQAVQLSRNATDEEYIDFEEEEEDYSDDDAYMVSEEDIPDLQPLDYLVIDDIWENNQSSSY